MPFYDAQRRCSAAGRAERGEARTVGWNTLLGSTIAPLENELLKVLKEVGGPHVFSFDVERMDLVQRFRETPLLISARKVLFYELNAVLQFFKGSVKRHLVVGSAVVPFREAVG